MTERTSWSLPRKHTIGDTAVDGLLAGMAAGLAMGVVLLALGLVGGVGPAATLGRFDPAEGGSAVVGALLHLAVSGLYGVVFALLWRLLGARWAGGRRYAPLVGLAYGLALWLAARFVLLPGMGSGLVAFAPWQFALAHLVYGAVLGYGIGRQAANRCGAS